MTPPGGNEKHGVGGVAEHGSLPDISRLMTDEESAAALALWNDPGARGDGALPAARRIEILPFQWGGKKYALVSDNKSGDECERMLSFLLSASKWCEASGREDVLRILNGLRGRYYACVRAANPLRAGLPPSDERSFPHAKSLLSGQSVRLLLLLRKSWAEGAYLALSRRGLSGEPALPGTADTAREFAQTWNLGRLDVRAGGLSPEVPCPDAEVVRLPGGDGYAVVLSPFLDDVLAVLQEAEDAVSLCGRDPYDDGKPFLLAALAAARPDLSFLVPGAKEATFSAAISEFRRCLSRTADIPPSLPEETIESIRARRQRLVRGLFSLLKDRTTAEAYADNLAGRKAIVGRHDLLLKGYLFPPCGTAIPVPFLFEGHVRRLWLVAETECAEAVSWAEPMAGEILEKATRMPDGEERRTAEQAVLRYHVLMNCAAFPCQFRTRAERLLRTERARRSFLRWRKAFLSMNGGSGK